MNLVLLCYIILPLSLQALFKAGEEHFGTDEQAFVTILGNRSAEHLRKGLCVRERERKLICSSSVRRPPYLVCSCHDQANAEAACVAVFDAYMKLSGYEMEESIQRETSGCLRDLLLAVGTRRVHIYKPVLHSISIFS